ncbi:ABC transporter ATP-binding protein [Streptomyces sp. NPDC051561]|uniref:ABC transporter ATP-binding protein n=1 Tax=Streptomyces sp. NPDC051561 TaxID=3365658 RepID=UPI0037A36981
MTQPSAPADRTATAPAPTAPAPSAPAPTGAAVRLDGVTKVYGRGTGAVHALRGVDAVVPRGSFTAVMGPSGSGKSTFLHCAAGLDLPTGGRVSLGEQDLSGLNEDALTRVRRERIGFVFQAFNLMPSLTVEQNITLPLRLAGRKADARWLAEIVERVGLTGRTGRRPSELSGGQQQRVALARALVTRPEVVFGDEPTGALDTVTAKEVLGLLRRTVDLLGQTVVMVTHDPVAASYADAVLFLADGQIVDRMAAPTVERVSDRMTRLGAWA